MIDGNKLPLYLDNAENNAEWEQTDRRLKELCNGMNALEILVCCVDSSDYNSLRIVFDAVNDARTDHDYTLAGIEVTDDSAEFEEKYKTMFRQIYEKREESFVIVEDFDRPWITAHLTAVVPVKDDAGNVAGLVGVMLEMRYLNGAPFFRVAMAIHYDERTVYRLHRAGLRMIAALLARDGLLPPGEENGEKHS